VSLVAAPENTTPEEAPKSKKAGGKKSSKPKVTPDISRREEILDAIIESLQQALPVNALSPDEVKQLVPPNHPDVCVVTAVHTPKPGIHLFFRRFSICFSMIS
jgi:hypothetical protein